MTKLLKRVGRLERIIRADIDQRMSELDDCNGAKMQLSGLLPGRHQRRLIAAHASVHPARDYIAAFDALGPLLRLVAQKNLSDGLEEAARKYRDCLLTLGCSKTVAMHVLVDEVPRLCKRLQHSLGYHSEESAESMHQEEKKFEMRWRVGKSSSIDHAAALMKAMCGMNAEHAFVTARDAR